MWQKKICKLSSLDGIVYQNVCSTSLEKEDVNQKKSKIKKIFISDIAQTLIIEFEQTSELRKAYDRLLKLNPMYHYYKDDSQQKAGKNEPIEPAYSTQYYDFNFLVDKEKYCCSLLIILSHQTIDFLKFFCDYLKDLDNDIPEELLIECQKNPRELNELEKNFYEQLDKSSDVEQDKEILLSLANSITQQLKIESKNRVGKVAYNHLWALLQKCIPHSDLWLEVLNSIDEDTSYYHKAQYELALFQYSKLSDLHFLDQEYFDTVKKCLQHTINTDPESDNMNLLNTIIFTIIGENAGISLGNLSNEIDHDDLEENITHILTSILISHKSLQEENSNLKYQFQELTYKYEQLEREKKKLEDNIIMDQELPFSPNAKLTFQL